MIIHVIMGTRKSDNEDAPEVLTAWDEFSVDANPEGFVKDRDEQIKSWGDDLAQWRQIDVVVPDHVLRSAFGPTRVVVPS